MQALLKRGAEMKSKIEELVEHFGGQYRLAGALNVSSAAVHYWIRDGALPPFRAIQIEQITNGEFLAVDLIAKIGGVE